MSTDNTKMETVCSLQVTFSCYQRMKKIKKNKVNEYSNVCVSRKFKVNLGKSEVIKFADQLRMRTKS